MSHRVAHRPSAGHVLFRSFAAALTLATVFLTAAAQARAEDSLPSPEIVHLLGQTIEEWRIRPVGSVGTVVFENGSRAELEGWRAVVQGIARPVSTPASDAPPRWSVFAYNRPGIGRSEATERPRDGKQIVADLHSLLLQQGFKPPYLLVGHSLGGLYMQLFAREHPDEVEGLLLVDALYPGVIKKPEDFPFYTRWGKALFVSAMASREIDAIHATGEAVLALPWDARIPVIRLVNEPKSVGAIAVDFGVVNADEATIARVRAMYPGAKTVVLDSDHQIQEANPEAVVQAIRELQAKVLPAGRP